MECPLRIVTDWITKEEERDLLHHIHVHPWDDNPDLQRRTQQFGYIYSYRRRACSVRRAEHVGPPLPTWIRPYLARLESDTPIHQMIVNEYTSGQGIAAHLDAAAFGPTIYSISLASDAVFRFECILDTSKWYEVTVPRRSLLVLEGAARNLWTHAIPARKRSATRISITLRSLVELNQLAQSAPTSLSDEEVAWLQQIDP